MEPPLARLAQALRKSAILSGFELAGRRIALRVALEFSVIFEYGGLMS
jgi:hypothetical protein